MKTILIFGGTGSIGNYLYNSFKDLDYKIYGTTSKNTNNENFIYVDNENMESLLLIDNLDIIIWAHGYNYNDNKY